MKERVIEIPDLAGGAWQASVMRYGYNSKKFGFPKLLIFKSNEYATLETIPEENSVIMRDEESFLLVQSMLNRVFAPALINEIQKLIRKGSVVELDTNAYSLMKEWIAWCNLPNDNKGGH